MRAQEIRNPKPLAKPRGETLKLTTLVPVLPFQRRRLEQDLAVLHDAPVPGNTHFARWCIVDRLETPSRFGSDPTSYLLFSAWFDKPPEGTYDPGPVRPAGSGPRRADLAQLRLRGGWPRAFERFLNRHRVEAGSSFASYDGVKVDDIRRALTLWNHFHDFAAKSQTQVLRGPALQEAWRRDPVLGKKP